MKKYIIPIIILNLLLALVYINHSVTKKEKLLKEGRLVLLELAPVDPRSLMQGDYMALRYKISSNIPADSLKKRGYCVVTLDARDIVKDVRYQSEITPTRSNEYPIAYTRSNRWNINIGAESFFFQEGKAKKYEKAKYGGLKIDKNGNSLLIGLYDENLRKIE